MFILNWNVFYEILSFMVFLRANNSESRWNDPGTVGFEIDVTDEIKPGQDNELMMWVADAQLFNQPGKYGRRIALMTDTRFF